MTSLDPTANAAFHILLLQKEEYNIGRFWESVFRTWGRIPKHIRTPIVWTWKLRMVNALATIFTVGSAYVVSLLFDLVFSGYAPVIFLVSAIGFSYVYFVFLTIAVVCTIPFDTLVKHVIIYRATRHMAKFPKVTIIGIAGSYGKTTMKEIVSDVLSAQFTVVKTPDNINTPIGISRHIVKKLTPSTDILVVEMGEYYPQDIDAICEITPPSLGIITGINEAHLERMKSLDVTAKTVFELAQNIPQKGLLLVNSDDERVRMYAPIYANHTDTRKYSSVTFTHDGYSVKHLTFHEDGSGFSCELFDRQKKVLDVRVPHLAPYVIGDIIAAVTIARFLGMSWGTIGIGLQSVRVPPHRLQPIINAAADTLVIDDSYNGNPEGVAQAIQVLSKFRKRRKVFITPGLVETGSAKQTVHETIGTQLASVADVVILIRNSVTPYIENGLLRAGFPKTDIHWFPDAGSCHAGFMQYIKAKDVILFQNDWPDNYV